MSRDELIVLVGVQADQIAGRDARIAAQDVQIAAMAMQMAELRDANGALADRLAKLEHLMSRNSKNSSSPPSKDDDPGKTPPEEISQRRGDGSKRKRGKQPGARGANLSWTEGPDAQHDRFPKGRCGCGSDLAGATDLGVVDRYQQHEIPQVTVTVTQYDQHSVRCGCGKVHTAARPEGARPGIVGYGPNLQSFVVYLMVVHFIPAHRCVALLASLTGAAPSVGFVHGMLARVAGLLGEVDKRIRALITLAHAVSCDETPLRVGPRKPKPGKKKADQYLLVVCTELYTHYLLGDRSLDTFKAFVLKDLTDSVIVHDRYQNYDSAELGELTHQLCCSHLLRDLDGAAEVYPDAHWPTQIADALRALIHEANLARDHGLDAIAEGVAGELIDQFRNGVLVGLSDTTGHGNRPGERKARLLLEVLRDRRADVLRFAHDLTVPPTSNQAERDLRPSKIQQNISGRLTSEQRTRDRYTIRGVLSTAAKHRRNMMDVLREALLGHPWVPPHPNLT
jgi:transposase